MHTETEVIFSLFVRCTAAAIEDEMLSARGRREFRARKFSSTFFPNSLCAIEMYVAQI